MVASLTTGGQFALIVSPNRNNRSTKTLKTVSGRGGVGLTITLHFNGCIRRGLPRMEIVCAHAGSIFVPLGRHTGVTGHTGTSLFVSIRAGTLPTKGITHNFRACALNVRHTGSGLSITVQRGSIVSVRGSCRRECRNFSPHSSRDCVVFRFVRNGGVRHDMSLTQVVRQNIYSNTGHPSGNIRRTKFLILERASVPNYLVRLKFVAAPSRRHLLGGSDEISSVTHNVCRTFTGCGGGCSESISIPCHTGSSRRIGVPGVIPSRRPTPGAHTMAEKGRPGHRRTAPRRPGQRIGRIGGPRPGQRIGGARAGGRIGGTRMTSTPIFGLRVFMNDEGLHGNSTRFGNRASCSDFRRNGLIGCALNTSAGCGRVCHLHGRGLSGFPRTFVVTFGGKRGCSIGRTVQRFGRGHGQ